MSPLNVSIRWVAGAPVEIAEGDGTSIEEPGPGWRRTADRGVEEWIRDDNRVVINKRGGLWRAYVRAERSILWDLVERGEAGDDGRRLYLPAGSPSDTLWGAVIEAGVMFALLPEPLPAPVDA